MAAPRAPVACVDLGTNTCHLLVARVDERGAVQVLEDVQDIVRLGQGVARAGVLHPDAKQRTLASLARHGERARKHGAEVLRLVGTSALRDAQDGPAFAREVEERTGFHVSIIAGTEEATLTWESLAAEWPDGAAHVNVFDVGGGSTELMHGTRGGLEARRSVDVGTVRMTERFLRADPPAPDELQAMESAVRGSLRDAPVMQDAVLVGMAGTVTTLAACIAGHERHDPARVHGMVLERQHIRDWYARLRGMTQAQRLEVPALEPGRADLITSGACIVLAVMERCGARELVVSDRGVRWGLFHRTWAEPGPAR